MEDSNILENIDLDLAGHSSGKVRESWLIDDDLRLLVTTDRLSVFDRVVGRVQHKGQVLNQLALWWFDQTKDIIDNHIVQNIDPNAVVVQNAMPLPVEVIMRSRLTGSTSTAVLPKYLAGERNLYGYDLPDGIEPHGELPFPMLTPTTKAQDGGHDEPTTAKKIIDSGLVNVDVWNKVEKAANMLFERGTQLAHDAGYILADTKYEFGIANNGDVILIDEVHTPDSPRFWANDSLEQRLADGLGPENFDKEPIRLSFADIGYKGDGPVPDLDQTVWDDTSQRYVKLFQDLTRSEFVPGETPIEQRIKNNVISFCQETEIAAHPNNNSNNQSNKGS